MKRTGFLKRGKRLASVSKKTRTGRWAALRALRAHILTRAKGRCEFVAGIGHSGPLDGHHCVKRSHGGADDPSNVVVLCRKHHQDTDLPLVKGRLVVIPQGDESFVFATQYGEHKWAFR